jgi:uncharacterized protein YjiK
VIATGYAQGTGVGPQLTFQPQQGSQSTLASGLPFAAGVAVDASGNIYISSIEASSVKKQTRGAPVQSRIGSGIIDNTGVALDGAGNVYILDSGANGPGIVYKETLQNGSYVQSVAVPPENSASSVQ